MLSGQKVAGTMSADSSPVKISARGYKGRVFLVFHGIDGTSEIEMSYGEARDLCRLIVAAQKASER